MSAQEFWNQKLGVPYKPLAKRPVDVNLGPHTQCDDCALWHPEELVEFTYGYMLCGVCKERYLSGRPKSENQEEML